MTDNVIQFPGTEPEREYEPEPVIYYIQPQPSGVGNFIVSFLFGAAMVTIILGAFI